MARRSSTVILIIVVAVSAGPLAVGGAEGLPSGTWPVAGELRRADTAGPAVGVVVTVRDLVADAVLPMPGAVTDPSGRYEVFVPAGIYELGFSDPAPGGPQLAAAAIRELSVPGGGPVFAGSSTLDLGFHVTGQVRNAASSAVAGARVVVTPVAAGAEPVYLPDDRTNALGGFDVIVPAGTYDVRFDPPFGAALVPSQVPALTVSSDASLGVQILPYGFAISGAVVDPAGQPQGDVQLSVASSSTGQGLLTAHDRTDAAGQYQVFVPTGVWHVTATPTRNSLLDPVTLDSLAVVGPTMAPDAVLAFHNEDNDSIPDAMDNCPLRSNPIQEDFEGDGVGSPCDNCPLFVNPRQQNNDLKGGGDACDPDDDNDNTPDFADNDLDGDSVANIVDNCANARNVGQYDLDGNGAGDACDATDGEVEYLEARTPFAMTWRPEQDALGYQVYRQRLEWLSPINYGVCFQQAPPEATLFYDARLPTPGGGFAYVVAAVTEAGEGSLGRSAGGPIRFNLRPCPDNGPPD